ncbi:MULTISPECIES: FAD-dependent monooxygenase [Dyadobacter]|uniref:FAD-dependent monooxygenase n=2 Tax=Dyadobacter TaxID=120831 RepID=A0A5R9KMH7_9BACT|nr:MULTISPECIES: NAD(P)/FAD-dependent oxidoreductase [Dyadobacter]KAA6439773.1 FAD-dependent monooxygenase [Dyadobacter flavalbus]TLU97423.1 FAD-dependent monooxygenase [Dyadobacter sediminis]GGC15228.1 2-polyprenyl-6-methoxyphenol hydroxylase [Dyadobacter sediminis]
MNKQVVKSDMSVVVVGASLAGLMMGIALAKAGMKVTILERVGTKPRSGAVLQVDSGERDNSATAKSLRKLASGGLRSAQAWSSIQSRLHAAALDDARIELIYDTPIRGADQNDEMAWVVTDTGKIFSGDIVIGADGHRSIVRRMVAPQKPNATFAGYMIWVAILNEQDIAEKYWPDADMAVSMPDGIGDFLLGSVIQGAGGSRKRGERRLGWAWYDNTRNHLLRELGCVRGSLVHHSLIGTDIPGHTLTELADQARERWPQPWLAATLHSIQTRALTAIPVSEYVPNQLVNKRIAITGDAAHVLTPISAAGFNASLLDAATLTDCILQQSGLYDPVSALSRYESLRLKPVQQMVQSGQSFSRSFGR